MEVRLEIDAQDASAIREKILSLVAGNDPMQLKCVYDKGIFRGEACFVDGSLQIRCSEDEGISRQDGGLMLSMDADSWDLLAASLEKRKRGERYAPEICELPVEGKKKEMTLILATHR